MASITQDCSTVPRTSAPASGAAENTIKDGCAGNSPIKDQNQQLSIDTEGRGKKKSSIHGKVRGIGAVPKGRGHAATGWTGAGFDVDGRG